MKRHLITVDGRRAGQGPGAPWRLRVGDEWRDVFELNGDIRHSERVTDVAAALLIWQRAIVQRPQPRAIRGVVTIQGGPPALHGSELMLAAQREAGGPWRFTVAARADTWRTAEEAREQLPEQLLEADLHRQLATMILAPLVLESGLRALVQVDVSLMPLELDLALEEQLLRLRPEDVGRRR